MWRFIIISVALFFSHTVYGFSPDVKANGQDQTITINTDDQLYISISMNSQGDTQESDWWVIASTPLASPHNWYSFNGSSWQPGITLTYQQALTDLNLHEVLSVNKLPVGEYTFYFGVDIIPNGSLNMGENEVVYDRVTVIVSAETLAPVESAVSFDYIDVSPRAIYADAITSTPVIVETKATGNHFNLTIEYYEGGLTGEYGFQSETMYDDGSHGDKVAGDNIWTGTINYNIPNPRLRLYNYSVDSLDIWIRSTDNQGKRIFPSNSNDIPYSYEVGIINRDFNISPLQISSSMLASDFVVNMVTDNFTGLYDVDSITKAFYEVYDDDFDFIHIFYSGKTMETGIAWCWVVQNDTKGIGDSIYSMTDYYGSVGKLQAITYHTIEDLLGTSLLHETGHRYGFNLDDPRLNLTSYGGYHYRTSSHVGQMVGFASYLEEQANGDYLVTNPHHTGTSNNHHLNYSNLELYLMGLVPANEVPSYVFVLDDNIPLDYDSIIPASSVDIVTIDNIIDVYGERIPSYDNSQKNFRSAFIIVSEQFVSGEMLALLNRVAQYYGSNALGNGVVRNTGFWALDPPSFAAATGFRASMETELPEIVQ